MTRFFSQILKLSIKGVIFLKKSGNYCIILWYLKLYYCYFTIHFMVNNKYLKNNWRLII